ncbi:F-actin capping protein alpha subunit [Vararia minispora EC-137]|uniref:F-actin capping protein alpha subunit n=1 Tax=Vararia minispora EC-137 TaxID=1314806 RepID=A0ACB8QXF0_9AGAM|nr:F-actin capping protein alpha subunit [Vararia minispora EC-137]
MNEQEHIAAVSSFLLQSPPGQINDVLNDVRNIVADDESLQQGIMPALLAYNLAQFIVADIPGTSHTAIVSEAAKAGEEDDRFVDPRSKTSYKFDHIALEASDPQPIELDAESEPFRAALESATLQYLSAHYHEGNASVFATPNTPRRFTIQIVANKYNPANFWSGRWRSQYDIDLVENTVTGLILVNVHYYENGNVQLETKHNGTLALPPTISVDAPSPSATKLLALIKEFEGTCQVSLSDTYHEMGEKSFKALRRALPLTRQKLDWEKVLGYKLGQELAGAKVGGS